MEPRTSADWADYFAANTRRWDDFDWSLPAGVTRQELRPILPSIQAWQLGETSDGRHLRAAARRYAATCGDVDFPRAVEGFIREEQTHGEALGRFLDAIGVPRVRRYWGDSVFRGFRYALSGIELRTTIVVLIETSALLFYAALRRATPSPLLQAICAQMLRDEGPHLQFQCERLAMIHAQRRPSLLRITYFGQRVLYFAVVSAVWLENRPMLRAGGFTFASFWSQAWRKMNYHWQQMRPTTKKVATPVRHASLRQEAPSRLSGWLR